MPVSPAYPDTIRVTAIYTLPNTDVMENVVHWSVASGFTFTEDAANDLQFGWSDAWETHVKSHVKNSITLVKMRVQDLRTTPYPTFEFDRSVVGTATGDALMFQAAAVLSLRTTQPGRRGRGRVYLGGFTEVDNTAGGAIGSGLQTDILAFGAALRDVTTADSQDVLFAVLSRADATSYAVTTENCDTRWDVQRRRANRRVA